MRIITLIGAMLLSLIALAQEYRPMLVEGRQWQYKVVWPDYDSMTEEQWRTGDVPNVTTIHALTVSGEEQFDGRTCKMLYDVVNGIPTHIGYAFEQDRQVFVYLLYSMSEKERFRQFVRIKTFKWSLLYDFSVPTGGQSSIDWFSFNDYLLGRKDSIEVRGEEYMRQTWTIDGKEWSNQIVVEGIGSDKGLLPVENIATNGVYTGFTGCYDGEVCIFTDKDFSAPSLTGSPTSIGESLRQAPPSNYHDLQGRRLTAKPSKGLYIRDGRKVVVK